MIFSNMEQQLFFKIKKALSSAFSTRISAYIATILTAFGPF